MDDLRYCKHCNIALPISTFRRDRKYVTYTCKPCYYSYLKTYREENKEKIRIQKAAWYRSNAHLIVERYNFDIQNKLRRLLRNRLYVAIKCGKNGSAIKDLGCSIDELRQHLESKFQPGMTWDNWSRDGWHIDHAIPLSSVDLTNSEQFNKVCHYTNLQPLWAKENLSKGDRC